VITPVSEPKLSEQKAPLPGFSRLVLAVAMVIAPAAAICLVAVKLWWAGSLVAGALMSVAACGLLHVFVQKIMPYFIAGLQGKARTADPAAVVQFVGLLAVKFVILGLVGYAILNFHAINLPVVLIGFALAQTAIIFTVARHLNTR